MVPVQPRPDRLHPENQGSARKARLVQTAQSHRRISSTNSRHQFFHGRTGYSFEAAATSFIEDGAGNESFGCSGVGAERGVYVSEGWVGSVETRTNLEMG